MPLLLAAVGLPAAAQQTPPPQIKVHMINVCTPSAAEQKEMDAALSRVPSAPHFRPDFEVDRGRTSMDDAPNVLQSAANVKTVHSSEIANWVRIRREISGDDFFSTVQYSFSVDPKTMLETLVFRVRDPKDLMELSIEDSASNVTSAKSMLALETPATHIKLERFGKSSVALARCEATEAGPAPDQSAYEPLFQRASSILTNYRRLFQAKETVPEELRRASLGFTHAGVAHSAPAPGKKTRQPSK